MIMYFIVNNDLSMKKGKIAAQVGHAVGLYVDRVYSEGVEKDKYDVWMKDEGWNEKDSAKDVGISYVGDVRV